MMSISYDMSMSQHLRSRFHINGNLMLKLSLVLAIITLIPSTLAYAETITVDVRGDLFDVEYSVIGMTVTGITPDLPANSLIVDINIVDPAGFLTITFDRDFFDTGELNESFLILIDGDELRPTGIATTAEFTTLSLRIPSGSEEIEIIGTTLGVSAPPPPPPPHPGGLPIVNPDPIPVDEDEKPVVPEIIPDVVSPDAEKPKVMVDDTPLLDDELESPPQLTEDQVQSSKCGPGTILVDGSCVLDERCGPGTILQDGVCILVPDDQLETQTSSSAPASNKGLLVGSVAAFVIAGVIAVFLGLISKAHKR